MRIICEMDMPSELKLSYLDGIGMEPISYYAFD